MKINEEYIINAIEQNHNNVQITDKLRYVIYGAGNYGSKILKRLLRKGYEFECFLDRNKTGVTNGFECVKLEETSRINKILLNDNIVVLIGVHNRDIDPYEIKNKLIDIGFKKVYAPVEYYDFLGDDSDGAYWLIDRKSYLLHIKEIQAAYDIIKNKEVFLDVLDYRLGCVNLEYGNYGAQYMPEEIKNRIDYSYFVDAGAYDGDTIKSMIDFLVEIKEYMGFEPDIENYKMLCNNLSKYSIMQFSCPVGLGDKNEVCYINHNGEAANIIDLATDVKYDDKYGAAITVRLDDIIKNHKVTFIKMDIEGYEMKALMGARSIIEKNVPSLAICVYHKPEHLWEIVLYLNGVCPDKYDFYMYQHAYNTFDVVLYAVRKFK